jgi:hypothetical protein
MVPTLGSKCLRVILIRCSPVPLVQRLDTVRGEALNEMVQSEGIAAAEVAVPTTAPAARSETMQGPATHRLILILAPKN